MTKALSAILLCVGCSLFQAIRGEEPVILSHLRTTNVDISFARWNKTSPIPYCFDTASPLTSTEQALVTSSLNTLTSTLGNCMTFTLLTSCTGPPYKLKFTALTDGTPSYAFPGINLYNKNTLGYTEQLVGLARDATNCLSDPRCIMKFGAISLGKRNEHDRGDRDNYISVNTPNVIPRYNTAYNLYNTSAAYWGSFPYDYCSITHNKMPDYAQPGTMAFTVKNFPFCIPELPTISKTDCLLISRMYSCSLTCSNLPDCSTVPCPTTTVGSTTSTTPASTTTGPTTTGSTTTGPTTTGSTTTGPTTTASTTTASTTSPTTSTTTAATTSTTTTATTTSTTTMTTTTTAPRCIDFCLETTEIDEASKLFNGNYYMFSGDCMVQIDSGNRMIGAAVKINTILPGVTGPVTSVWTDMRQITYVLAGTSEYVCFGTPANCQSVTPIPPMDTPMVRWEGTGATTYAYDPNPASFLATGAVYYNDAVGSTPFTPTNQVSCGAAACLIDSDQWDAAYTISLGTLQLVNVIGKDLATGAVRMLMTMMKSDVANPAGMIAGGMGTGTADNYQALSAGSNLTPLLGCPNALAG